jgi:glyoxylase-like metal-dependent hydrolase (beta-lactamase superfamily II)
MRRVGPHSFTEIYFAGCNPSYIETSDGYVMIDSPQQPIDAVRWRERLEEKAPIRYLVNTEPHGDHIAGNAYFPKVTVVGQVKLQECFDQYLNAFGSLDEKRERFKQMDHDSVWLVGHPDYPASNPPSLTFTDTLTLNVGDHTFNIIHMPGHTAPQTSVYVPEEGVVFTGDNVFHKCRTWMLRSLGVARRARPDRRPRCRDDRAGPRRAMRQGLSQRAGADRRELGRFYRNLCRPRGRPRGDPERTASGHAAGPVPDRATPVHA